MKSIIKLPSGINPVGGPIDPATMDLDWKEFRDLLAEFNEGLLSDNDGRCKHDLRTSFLEREVVVYCTKCEYRIKGAQVYGK